MEPPYNPELSLLELVQNQSPHALHTLGISSAVHWFTSICEILVNNQVTSILWAKFSGQSPWQAPIAMYGETGLLHQLYWCGGRDSIQVAAGLRLNSQVNITPLLLEFKSHLQGEDFVCFLSSEISLLIIFEKSKDNLNVIRILRSFCPETITFFLEELKQKLVITDSLSPDLFTPEKLPAQGNLSLVNQLIQGLAPHGNRIKSSILTMNSEAIANSFMIGLIRELGIPLTNTKTALQLLESFQQKKEARQRYLDLIKQNCDRQTDLITGLQELLEIDPMPPAAQAVEVADCITGVIGIYQPIAEEKSITLSYGAVEKCPSVACTVTDLRTILQQILENSLKFTPAEGRVQIKTYHRGPQVEILVKDTGCGIARADIPHLFDCFFRGQNAPAEQQGAGVGLAIVKSLLQRWGGKITVQSRPGQGSNFHIFLPVVVDNSVGHRFVTSN